MAGLCWLQPTGIYQGLFVLGAAAALIQSWRIFLASRYRPIPIADDEGTLPKVTVIVPAYNEGRQVLRSLRALARSDYPQDKLQIIAVNDGSKDDTLAWMRRACRELEGRIHLVDCPHNRGKRHALFEGFRRAKGEVIVTVDSDSEVQEDTLKALIAPFRDAEVGAVAGNVRVLAHQKTAIARMLDVSFTFGFELNRAAQSYYGAVICTPGALSAYRADLVRRFAEPWLRQRFLGQPANIGEDRAMTNLILGAGFHVRFQSSAVVHTEAPGSFTQLRNMLLRWARSNVRESLIMSRFVFRRFRKGSCAGARLLFVAHLLQLVVGALAFAPTVAAIALNPGLILWTALGAMGASLLPLCAYRILRGRLTPGLWAAPYALLSTFALSWIAPFACLSPHKTAWLTRELRPVLPPLKSAKAGMAGR